MWSIGPLARSVEDLYLAYTIIAGADGHDMDVPPVPVREMPMLKLADLRLAWAPTFPGVPVAGSIRQAIEHFAVTLATLVARVEEALPPVDFGDIARCRAVLSRAVRVAFAPTEEEPLVPLPDYLVALDTRDRITAAWETFFEEWDALICPVCMVTAYPHCVTDTPLTVDGEAVNYWRAVGHCGPFNFTGHPSVVIPVGFDPEGLPIGVQIVGKRWQEERLLGIAARLAEVTGPPRWPDL
jgi:amidase